MCLTISVELPMMPKEEAKHLTDYDPSQKNVKIHFDGTTRVFGRGNPRLSISEAGERCGCSMLTDNADWNAPVWDIKPAFLTPLAESIEFIAQRAPNGLIVEALWAGDKPETNLELKLADLLRIVKDNQVGTKTRYIVSREMK